MQAKSLLTELSRKRKYRRVSKIWVWSMNRWRFQISLEYRNSDLWSIIILQAMKLLVLILFCTGCSLGQWGSKGVTGVLPQHFRWGLLIPLILFSVPHCEVYCRYSRFSLSVFHPHLLWLKFYVGWWKTLQAVIEAFTTCLFLIFPRGLRRSSVWMKRIPPPLSTCLSQPTSVLYTYWVANCSVLFFLILSSPHQVYDKTS